MKQTINEQAVTLARQGMRPSDIAKAIRAPRKSVCRAIHMARMQDPSIPSFAHLRAPRKHNKAMVAKVLKAYGKGMTYREIATHCGIPNGTAITIVRRELPNKGPRPPGRPRKPR